VEKKQKYGDPRLHGLPVKRWENRCKLLGLLKPEDFRKTDLPPVKLVAGIDPSEAV